MIVAPRVRKCSNPSAGSLNIANGSSTKKRTSCWTVKARSFEERHQRLQLRPQEGTRLGSGEGISTAPTTVCAASPIANASAKFIPADISHGSSYYRAPLRS